jgi:hypothetical protein
MVLVLLNPSLKAGLVSIKSNGLESITFSYKFSIRSEGELTYFLQKEFRLK